MQYNAVKALHLIGDDSFNKSKKNKAADTDELLRPMLRFGYGLCLYMTKNMYWQSNSF